MSNKYMSRKFILTVAGALIILVNSILEANGLKALDSDKVLYLVGMIASYILGEAWVDVTTVKTTKK